MFDTIEMGSQNIELWKDSENHMSNWTLMFSNATHQPKSTTTFDYIWHSTPRFHQQRHLHRTWNTTRNNYTILKTYYISYDYQFWLNTCSVHWTFVKWNIAFEFEAQIIPIQYYAKDHGIHTVKSTVRRKLFLNTCTAVSETMTKWK